MPTKKANPNQATNLLEARPYNYKGMTRWRYDISFRLDDGTVVRLQKRLFHTRGEAIMDGEREIAQYKTGLKKKSDQPKGSRKVKKEKQEPITTRVALDKVLLYYEKTQRRRPSTINAYRLSIRKYILPGLGEITWKDLSQKQIDELTRATAGLVNPRHLQVLKAAIKDSHRVGLDPPKVIIDTPPIRSKIKYDFITLSELDRLCRCADPRWSPVYRFLFFTGVRVGEFFSLRWRNVDFRRGMETVVISTTVYPVEGGYVVGPPKNGTERSIPLNQGALEALRELVRVRHPEYDMDQFPDPGLGDELVVPNQKGSYLAAPTLQAALKRSCKAAGMRRISPHTFRHSFASNLLAAGADVMEVKELLGHKSVAVTMRYIHCAPKGIRLASQRLDHLSEIA